MKENHKGALLDLDQRSRDRAMSHRSRPTSGWVSLAGRHSVDEDALEAEGFPRAPWLSALPLWLAAFRAGRLSLCWAAEQRRRRMFRKPVQITRFLAIQYLSLPSSLQDELGWLQELRVRQVVLPLDQEASDVQQVKAFAAIQNMRTENCRVAAVLQPKRGAPAEPEAWHQFCYWILSQVGWQLDYAQLGDGLEGMVRERKDMAVIAGLFALFPRLRRDYPGVALLAPGIERSDAVLPVQAWQRLLPETCSWDGLMLRAPAWQALESVGRENVFLRRLTLAGALAGKINVQVCFPSPPPGCDEAAVERIAGSVVRRTVLALSSGVSDRVTLGMDPAIAVAERQILSTAIRELVSQLDGAQFEQRLHVGDVTRDFVLQFSRPGHPLLLIGWTDGDPRLISVPFHVGSASDFLRRPVPLLPHPRIRLTRNMAYFVEERA